MVVSVGHFDSDQDEFVVDGKLHNGTALPGGSDDWQRSVERLHDEGHDVALEFERITSHHRLDRRMVERPASHPRDEYSLMMKMKTPYRMASILPPEGEYDALESIANDADQIDLPSRDAVEENPASIRRYSGPADGQPLSFTILYETGHVALHAREHCAHEGQFVFQVDSEDISRLFDAAYESGFGDLEHTYLGSKDSLGATALGVCAGDDQQWVYAYTDAPPTAFERFDRSVLDVSGTRLFETGEPGALEAALTSSRVAPALALLASEQDLIEQLPADVVLSGVRTGLESQQAMTCYDALEVLSVLGGPVPDTTWTALTQCEYRHPDVVHEIASMLAADPNVPTDTVQRVASELIDATTVQDERTAAAAVDALALLGEPRPTILIDALPVIETILDDGTADARRAALDALLVLAKEDPEHLTPLASTLLDFVDEQTHPVRSSAVVGHLAKSLPNVATPAIETFGDWLDEDADRIRNNGLAVLADLTTEYPEQVLPYAASARELLWDDDEYVRYNATSVLAGLARTDPSVVEPVADRLRDLLDVDHAPTQQNACWALGRIDAADALPQLRTLKRSSGAEPVRAAAAAAEILLTTTQCPRCGAAVEPHEATVAVESTGRSHWTCPECDRTTTSQCDEVRDG